MIINDLDNNDMEYKKPHKVQYRGGFSDRNGIKKISTKIQLKNFDKRTRIAICNLFYKLISGEINIDNFDSVFFYDNACENFFNRLISEVYCEPLADFSYDRHYKTELYKEYVEPIIMNDDYADILSMLEFLYAFATSYNGVDYPYDQYSIIVGNLINDIFETEYVGYRLIDGIAVPISDDVEQKEIEETLKVPFDGCRLHINKSLGFLSDREKPDYKNSIKESISAVESICQIITENNKATLGQALKLLEDKGIKLHSALKNSFSSLYGYTSDEGGIRVGHN